MTKPENAQPITSGSARTQPEAPAAPDPRAIWESLTPAQRRALLSVYGGDGLIGVSAATERVLKERGLLIAPHDRTDLGRAVAEAGKAGA